VESLRSVIEVSSFSSSFDLNDPALRPARYSTSATRAKKVCDFRQCVLFRSTHERLTVVSTTGMSFARFLCPQYLIDSFPRLQVNVHSCCSRGFIRSIVAANPSKLVRSTSATALKPSPCSATSGYRTFQHHLEEGAALACTCRQTTTSPSNEFWLHFTSTTPHFTNTGLEVVTPSSVVIPICDIESQSCRSDYLWRWTAPYAGGGQLSSLRLPDDCLPYL
jgi:hypothetical protein